jgi:hypothetical protein
VAVQCVNPNITGALRRSIIPTYAGPLSAKSALLLLSIVSDGIGISDHGRVDSVELGPPSRAYGNYTYWHK